MTLLHCPYCAKEIHQQDLLMGLSKLRGRPLNQRTYAFRCRGRNFVKPHSPIICFLDVLSTYSDGRIKLAKIEIFQVKAPAEVYANYRDYLKRKEPHRKAMEKKGGKDKNDPNIAPLKCAYCRSKLVLNRRASTLKGRMPYDRTLTYECRTTDTTFNVKRFKITKNTNLASLPFDVDLLDYPGWEKWMVETFSPYSYDGGMLKIMKPI